MIELRPLVVGCDDHSLLPIVLNELKMEVDQNYIVASQPADLLKIIKSSNPVLVIISFKNNQEVIRRICQYFKSVRIPILCLIKHDEIRKLNWNNQDIVFTHSLESIGEAGILSLRIKSLLLLIQNSNKTRCYQNNTTANRDKVIVSNGNLARYVMELDKKSRLLLKIKKSIKQLYFNAEGSVKNSLMSIVNSIQTGNDERLLWDDFKLYFEDLNPLFIKHLSLAHPGLTHMDIKYCCFLKMNLSTDEIRCIFGISQESVRTHKYRLKKKLELSKDQNLLSYIISLPKNEKLEFAY